MKISTKTSLLIGGLASEMEKKKVNKKFQKEKNGLGGIENCG